ncbi:regulatory factor X-associated protein-like [Patiria miniata]|uniref:Regulatory factor X-associated protein RFXANK-binding domain-containing protein n=1 Tax=Patiria miniata TaxID=46514 RepID=A0A913ZX74_PATMI|nr:regulatory factor X-associated protein-like [Patiria miniata]
MSSSQCSSQDGSAADSQTELDNQSSAEKATSPMLIKHDSSSHQRAESSSSLSSSSSTSSTCSKEDKVEMTCTVKGCEKSAYKSRRYQLLPWKCKYHRNKTYKETYKRRKAMANQDPFSMEVKTTGHEPPGDRLGGAANRHRQGEQGSMLEQVLNEKKMALMQSPIVLEFLQKQQQKKHQQHKHQQHKHQQKSWGLQQVRGYGPASHR